MKQDLQKKISEVCRQLFGVDAEVELTRPEEKFGDYATNVALQLAKQLGKNPREVGEELANNLREDLAGQVSEVSVAGPGFVNLKLSDQTLAAAIVQRPAVAQTGVQVLIEFGDPNPFKEMHLGHLYAAVAGDTIARLFEAAGAKVYRVSYHGDVGMHVAKAIWAIKKHLDETPGQTLDELFAAAPIGQYYAEGARAFEEDEAAAEQIKQVNARVYARDDEQINSIYNVGRELSFKNFDDIFNELGVHFVKRYLESDSSQVGIKTVRQYTGKVFEESEGAIVYRGEKAGLHTRVFINSRGLPTYEAKDLGLAEMKHQDYPNIDQSIIVTANEQVEYFKVMLAALAEIDSQLAAKTRHISHGFLSLSTGKMSSRTGDVYAAVNLLDSVQQAVKEQFPSSDTQQEVYMAAVKYTFLKNRIGGDIVFNVKESVALEGHSGPYLQYAHARARSILAKAGQAANEGAVLAEDAVFEPGERSLARKITEYAEVVDKAVTELMPHHVCTYLYELAQNFNSFYEQNRVIGDQRQMIRLALVVSYANTLKSGLELLGIAAPSKM